MQNVVLVIHLLLALCLIGIVLLQRSEGGGLGMGGGGGGVVSGRSAATALNRLTWVFATAFIITSLLLTVIAARNSAGQSVLDRLGVQAPTVEQEVPQVPAPSEGLLPPAASDAPLVPPRAD